MATPQITRALYEELTTKGRRLQEELDISIKERGHTYKPLKEIATGYDTILDPPELPGISDLQQDKLEDTEALDDQHILVQVYNPAGRPLEPAYQNYIHKGGRAILCMCNYAERDVFSGRPERIYWSDLMAVAFSGEDDGCEWGRCQELARVWRLCIRNETTLSLIRDVHCRQNPPRPWVDNTPSDDDFLPLLVVDNGRGVVGMLAIYPNMFGCKAILRVRRGVRVFNSFLVLVPEEVGERTVSVTLMKAPRKN